MTRHVLMAVVAAAAVAGCGSSTDDPPAPSSATTSKSTAAKKAPSATVRQAKRIRRYLREEVAQLGSEGRLVAGSVKRVEVHSDGSAYVETDVYNDADAQELGPKICGTIQSAGVVHGHIQVVATDGGLIGSCG